MIADRVRADAYMRALRQIVRPGSVVVEIGTGPGIFAVFACQLGASRVYAIEADPIIQVAREVAADNHCEDKIEFIENLSTKVTLPVQGDVLLSDLRGALPFFGRHIPSLADARRRFLAPGGIMIPRKDVLWAAVVEAPESYSRVAEVWDHNEFGQNLTAAQRLSVNECHSSRATADKLLTKPQLWATLDYATVEDPDVQGGLEWTIARAGTGFGVLVWFEADLAQGVGFSCAPGTPEGVYCPAFFPWAQPVPLVVGQTVRMELCTKLMEDDYLWRWTTLIESANQPGEVIHRFEQSQLKGDIMSLAKLHKTASDHVPQLSDEGRLHRRALELMDGETSLEDISRRLVEEFPLRFERWQQALTYAGACSQQYGS